MATLLMWLATPGGLAISFAGEPAATRTAPCGLTTLAMLARLKGIDGATERLRQALGPGTQTGHSLREMIVAGQSVGVRLRGVRVEAGDWRPDGPAILHVVRSGESHYVVVRPVGRLVQILDPLGTIQVIEPGDLTAKAGWTGIALIAEPSGPAPAIATALGGLVLILLFLCTISKPRSRLMTTRLQK